MFEQNSRYFQLENLSYVDQDGVEIKYKSRRILPQSEVIPSMVRINVESGKRLDQISAAMLEAPEFYWKLGDANNAFSLEDLESRGVVLKIPMVGIDHT